MSLNIFLDCLNKEITRKIRRIDGEEKDILKREYSTVLVLAEANSSLKTFIIDYEFADEQEEIYFFKYAKPQLVSQLIYHCQVYNIEMNRPVGGMAIQRDYLNHELYNLQDYIDRRPEFYSYYRLGSTYNDVNYFTRDKFVLGLQYLEPTLSEREPKYSTNCVPSVVGVLNGLLGFSQSSAKTNEYTIKPELLHLRWVNARLPVKEGYISLKLKASGESEITIPAACTVKVVAKNDAKPLLLNKAGTYTFRL